MIPLEMLEKKLQAAWAHAPVHERTEAASALQDARARIAKVQPLLEKFHGDLTGAVAAAEPAVRAGVETLVTAMISDAAALLASRL